MDIKTRNFIAKANQIHKNKYDYSKVLYINSSTKVHIICPIHGTFEQTPNAHLRSGGCKQCGVEKRSSEQSLNTQTFIDKAHKIHQSYYDYSKTNYINSITPITITCLKHGDFTQRPSDHLRGKGCKKCSYENRGRGQTLTTSTFIKRAIELHGVKYDYSKVDYISHDKHVSIVCPEHGEFQQLPSGHLSGKGCKKCGYDLTASSHIINTEEFIKRSEKLYENKYDYSKSLYLGCRIPITVICPKHGIFTPKPYKHLQGKGCPKCSCNISTPELELQTWLKSLNINIQTNTRNIIDPLEIDIYIKSLNLAVEYNGLYWHSELKGKTRNYHLNKTLECNKKGIRLLHINEDEWIEKNSIVKARLKNILGLTKYSLYGRKCTITEIPLKIKNKFLKKYHIQGVDNSSIALGAFYKNRLVAVMTFGKNRYGENSCYELIRYATISSFNCIGVAGKLLKFFERNYECSKIKTYADLRWSEGNLYKQLGFNHTHNSTPNYHYIKNGKLVGSRVKFQKHKLKDKLDVFDPNLSEWENMKANGYDRVWNCGNMVFEKIIP